MRWWPRRSAGKDVTVIIELRARFDEEANIELSTRLQEAGAHVMYGVVGYKTHAKMTLIVRREADGIRRYCHLGTGNYHPRTARIYTDYGLFTCDEEIGHDVHEIFLQLTSLTQTPQAASACCSRRSAARDACSSMIERETEHARAGQPGAHHRQAQRAGGSRRRSRRCTAPRAPACRIDLIVRGVCALRPGIPGVSENIRCARSSAASSSTRACSGSRTAGSTSCTAPAPTGWSAISSAASRSPSRSAHAHQRERILRDLELCLMTSAGQQPTPGSCSATAATCRPNCSSTPRSERHLTRRRDAAGALARRSQPSPAVAPA